MAIASTFHAAGESMRATAAAQRYQEAVSRARSHLDALSARLAAGEQSGDDGGGFHWRVAVRAIGSTARRNAAEQPANSEMLVVTLYAVTVWITWMDGGQTRSARLDSARLLTTSPG
jgi:hypothetical protein